MDYNPYKNNKTLLYAYNHHIRHIEGFSIEGTILGSIPKMVHERLPKFSRGLPDFAHNTFRGSESSFNSLSRYLNGTDIKLSKLDYRFIEGYLVISKTGQLERLECPFEVLVIQDVGELHKGLICLVNAVKLDLTLIDVYIIGNKAYYFFNFRVLGRK